MGPLQHFYDAQIGIGSLNGSQRRVMAAKVIVFELPKKVVNFVSVKYYNVLFLLKNNKGKKVSLITLFGQGHQRCYSAYWFNNNILFLYCKQSIETTVTIGLLSLKR